MNHYYITNLRHCMWLFSDIVVSFPQRGKILKLPPLTTVIYMCTEIMKRPYEHISISIIWVRYFICCNLVLEIDDVTTI